MQLKNVLAVFAALNLVTAVPTPDEDSLEFVDGPEGGADEFEIVKRGQEASFWCKGAVVNDKYKGGVAGTKCGWSYGDGCGNLVCKSGKYIAWPAPKYNKWDSYIVCS